MKLGLNSQKIIKVLFAILAIVFISYLNYQIISGWFGKNGPANIGSIEVSYVSMGRFLRDFGFASWAPFWYLGFPFHLFYTPLLPFLEFLINQAGVPLWESYRLITGAGYILGPATVFFLGWQMSKRLSGGIVSGVLFSIIPSVFYFILPSGEVAQDRISNFWDPRRLTLLVRWGEGPHTLSLIFIPLVGVFFIRLLEKKNLSSLILTSVFLGLAGLTNAIGLFASILLIFSIFFVKLAQEPNNGARTFIQSLAVGFVALGLISFWYNLSFISNFFSEGGGTTKVLFSIFPWGWLLILAGLGAIYFLFNKLVRDFGIAVSFFWFAVVFGVVATYYLSAPPDESFRRLELLPQAIRYMVEVDMALSLLFGCIFAFAFHKLSQKIKASAFIEVILVVLMSFAAFAYTTPMASILSKEAGKSVDLNKIREKEIALWLKDNLDSKKGERVFVPGNYGFYLNYFSDVWQLRGGLFQASINFWPDHIHYQMVKGKDSEISLAWLKAINAKYMIVTTPASRELYREVENQNRFESMKLALNEAGDLIYEVPLKSLYAAKVVNVKKMAKISTPKKADDTEALFSYVDWMENSGKGNAEFEMAGHDSYKIKANVEAGEGILVQMTYDEGWKANSKNGKFKNKKDPLGLLVLEPLKAGSYEIVLSHRPSWKIYLGWVVSFVSLAGLIYIAVSKEKLLMNFLAKKDNYTPKGDVEKKEDEE